MTKIIELQSREPALPSAASTARVNGVNVAFKIRGNGPPLVLIMGYRLNSSAWPQEFLDALARRFTVITLDNRGTGKSDKPMQGYAVANLARDVCGLLDALKIDRAHILGYSMGGAIAQEFVRQFPTRVAGLVLCATMCGGRRAIYARASVLRIMRDLDGLKPEEIARRIWTVTYSPKYLAENSNKAERQMLNEIVDPTPLHAADLQFQAFVDFDSSDALPSFRAPTLVLTGDRDELIPPGNSKILAQLIPGAELQILRGVAHRLMWEAPLECAATICDFLEQVDEETGTCPPNPRRISVAQHAQKARPSPSAGTHAEPTEPWREAAEFLTRWPFELSDFATDLMIHVFQPLYFGRRPPLGDGKPVVLAPGRFGGQLALTALVTWLRGIGYRPVKVSVGREGDAALAEASRSAVRRIGRKAVIIAFDEDIEAGLRVAAAEPTHISAVVGLAPLSDVRSVQDGMRLHLITGRSDLSSESAMVHRVNAWPWPMVSNPDALLILSEVLREIESELLAPHSYQSSKERMLQMGNADVG